MQGVLSLGGEDVKDIFNKELNMNRDEQIIAEHFIGVIEQARPGLEVTVERRSQSYLSLCVGDLDFLRFKYSDRAKWITVWNYGLDEGDERYAAQKNKRQSHWKASLSSLDDIHLFDKDALEACLFLAKANA